MVIATPGHEHQAHGRTVRVTDGGVPEQEHEDGVVLRIRSWKGTWDRDVA